jgi:hypothetical protein
VNGPSLDCCEWLAALHQGGVRVYWAKDTFVGSLAALSCLAQFA